MTHPIDIWQVPLTQEDETLTKLREILSADEKQRANRYRALQRRRQFIIGRAALRIILASYLNCDPNHVQLIYGQQGKPYLNPKNHSTTLHFNLTDSHELALIAVNKDFQVGIDIEYIRPIEKLEGIVQRYFTTSEQESLLKLSDKNERLQAFFCCWCRKEAFMKANGEGFSLPPTHFTVTALPDEEPRIVNIDNRQEENQSWSLFDLQINSEYTASLAVEVPISQKESLQIIYNPDPMPQYLSRKDL